jgi:predicted ester cyclase
MATIIHPERLAARLEVAEEYLRRGNAYDLEGLLATFGPEATLVLNGDRHRGRDGIRALYRLLLADFPDLRLEPQRRHCSGEAVFVEAVLQATRGRAARGAAAANRRVEVPIGLVFRFGDDDRLREVTAYFDGVLLLGQMGMLPLAA